MTESTPGRHGPIAFPLGYHSLHPDVSLNFQMNRWFGWVGEPEMLIEMGLAAKRIASYADWKREFLALASDACRRGHLLRAAREHGVDLGRSWMVGDKQIDVEAGLAAGARPLLVGTGYGAKERAAVGDSVPYAADLLAASRVILS